MIKNRDMGPKPSKRFKGAPHISSTFNIQAVGYHPHQNRDMPYIYRTPRLIGNMLQWTGWPHLAGRHFWNGVNTKASWLGNSTNSGTLLAQPVQWPPPHFEGFMCSSRLLWLIPISLLPQSYSQSKSMGSYTLPCTSWIELGELKFQEKFRSPWPNLLRIKMSG